MQNDLVVVLLEIFLRHVIFRNLSRTNWPLILIIGPLYAFYGSGLEGVAFVDQLTDAFGIRTLRGR